MPTRRKNKAAIKYYCANPRKCDSFKDGRAMQGKAYNHCIPKGCTYLKRGKMTKNIEKRLRGE